MRKLLSICLFSAFSATAALASDKGDAIATVQQYVADFNRGDLGSEVSRCRSSAIIIDDFAPNIWRGCREWADALTAASKVWGASDYRITLGEAGNVALSGDKAYAVFPTQIEYKDNGKPAVEHGVWTFVLQKLPAGWRISAWAWAAQ